MNPPVGTHDAFSSRSTRPRRRSSLAEKVDAASVLASLCLASRAKKNRVACADTTPPTSVSSPTKSFLNVGVSNQPLDESYIEHVLARGPIAEEKTKRNQRTIEDYAQQSFPETLMEILSNEHDCICWLSNNRGFIIKNKDKFANDVLPRYFKGSKYSSFTRKVKRWGFKRLPGAAGSTVYAHDKFKRDDLVLCVQLKCSSYSRPKKSSEAQAALKTSSKRPSAESPDDICGREGVDSRGMLLNGPCLSVATASNHLVPPGLKTIGPRQFSFASKRPSAESPDDICGSEGVDTRGMLLNGPCLSVATASNHLVPPGLKTIGPRQFSFASKRPSAESPDDICGSEGADSRGMLLNGPCLSVATASNHLVPPGLKTIGPRQFSFASCPQVASELCLPLEQVPTGAQSFPVRTGAPLRSYQPVRGRPRITSLPQPQQREGESYQSDLIPNDHDRRSLPGALDAFSNNQPAFDLQRSLSFNHLQLDRQVRRLITSSSSRNHQFIIEGAASALTAKEERHQFQRNLTGQFTRDELEAQALRLELEGCREELRNVQKGLSTFNRLNTR